MIFSDNERGQRLQDSSDVLQWSRRAMVCIALIHHHFLSHSSTFLFCLSIIFERNFSQFSHIYVMYIYVYIYTIKRYFQSQLILQTFGVFLHLRKLCKLSSFFWVIFVYLIIISIIIVILVVVVLILFSKIQKTERRTKDIFYNPPTDFNSFHGSANKDIK